MYIIYNIYNLLYILYINIYIYINPFKISLISILSKVSIRKDTPLSVMPSKHLVAYKKTIAVHLKPTQIYKIIVWTKSGNFNVQPFGK